jgi:regulator of protease activity HflC (stomatin/prohibitin superfamily)
MDSGAKTVVLSGVAVIGMIILIALFSGGFYMVSAGERAVLLTFGKPDMDAKSEGLHFKWPFIQKAVKMNVKTLKYATKADAASTDLQMVTAEIAVNFHLSPEKTPIIYKEIGLGYCDTIIQPAVQECVKANTAQFRAEELITKRELVKDKIDQMLRERLLSKNIIVETVSITHFDFSKNFNEAIEAKVTAEQNALAAKNKLEQVKYEAEQTVTKAKGEAEAIKIQAEAIQVQGGKDYVQLKAIEKWNGVMPYYTGGALPFIDISKHPVETK